MVLFGFLAGIQVWRRFRVSEFLKKPVAFDAASQHHRLG
jgi:hypothetical protein